MIRSLEKQKVNRGKVTSSAYININEEQLIYVLSHHHLDLMLDLSPEVRCDVVGQLIGGGLEVVDHLLELANHGVSRLLFSLLSVLHVTLELLDVCKDERQEKNLPSQQQHRTGATSQVSLLGFSHSELVCRGVYVMCLV